MYSSIMVPLDGSELAECVIPHVQAVASGGNVSNVTFVHVIEPLHLYGGLESRFSPEEKKRLEEDSVSIAREYLGKLTKQLEDKGIAVKSEVLYGKVIDQLADYADANRVDLIIIATHGRSGISQLAFGSVADRIIRSTKVPVLLVRAPGCTQGA